MKYSMIFLLCALSLSACFQERFASWDRALQDDFETISDISQLTEGEEARWRFYQQTNAENTYNLDSMRPHQGEQCLRFYARASLDGASKSAIAHNRLAFYEGERIRIKSWFFLEGEKDLSYLFLMDLEEDALIGAGPGLRLALEDSLGYLVIERNKMGEPTLFQASDDRKAFPRNEWVEIELEVLLGRKQKGAVKLWQNGVLLIDRSEVQTLPRDRLTLLQGTRALYHSLQLGITANSAANECVLYIDDVSIEILP